MVFLHGQVVTCTRETMKTIPETGMGKCTGRMEVTIRVSGKMVFSMEEVIFYFIKGKYTFQDKV